MSATDSTPGVRLACDAMCGGLARWLRIIGVDTTYEPGIDDGVLVCHAVAEARTVVSSDGPLFERREFASGVIRGVRLPTGLVVNDQLRQVVVELGIRPALPRCTACNGVLEPVSRTDVAGVVPARTLIWVRDYFRCGACEQVFWHGTHWGRIESVLARLGG